MNPSFDISCRIDPIRSLSVFQTDGLLVSGGADGSVVTCECSDVDRAEAGVVLGIYTVAILGKWSSAQEISLKQRVNQVELSSPGIRWKFMFQVARLEPEKEEKQ
jgi:hypothetical protein